MRSQAQRILEESEAQRAQAEAEFEIQLAARREEAERQEAERLSAAQSATQKLVSEAEQRASTAEQRAAKASAQADQTRRDADQHARQLVSNAKKNADQIVSQAKAQAEGLLAETKADAERRRAAAQREVDDLTRQKDSIASHLAQVRQLLGGQMAGMAGMDAAMQAAAPKPAIAADPAPAGTASGAQRNGNSGQVAPTTVQPVPPAGGPQATQVSPAPTQVQRTAAGSSNGGAATGTQATKQAPNGKEDDEDWWTE
jgi:F0F1-type ATP synthase membrane subunit b/b'